MEADNLAVMSFDGVHLLLPQKAVATVEVAGGMGQETNVQAAIGTLKSGTREWPVFALTAGFKTQSERPSSYKYCVGIDNDGQESFSIACEQVNTLAARDLDQVKSVPVCMRIPDCPIESIILKDSEFMLVSEVANMQHFLMPEVLES